MIKIVLIFLLVSINAWSKVSLELVLKTPSVKQGEITTGQLVVKEAEGQAILAGLKGKNLGKTLYLYDVSPFMGKQGQLEAEAKVIFFTVPEANMVSETVNNEEVVISWQNVEVLPTEASKSFLFGTFEVPERKKVIFWILSLLAIMVVGAFGFKITQFYRLRKKSQSTRERLKLELMNCTTYDDIVLMWRQKRRYLDSFPLAENSFKTLEAVLFRYQFKPHRTEMEKDEVLLAYQQFKKEVTEALNEK